MAEGRFMDESPWRCPRCRGALDLGADRGTCRSCGARFRALRGILDLRTRDDLYLSNEEDWAFALRLDEDYERQDFLGLLNRYFALAAAVSPEQKERQIRHILTAPGRVGHWLDALGTAGDGAVLDLGCGSGSFLSSVGRRVSGPCGVDIAMRWLLVARKRLDEEGLGHIPLSCACAEDLPLADSTLAGVVAGDVIEHVASQEETLSEVFRVLRPGGRLFMATPNRFSLGSEPHVGVWGVGFLPRRWMTSYVRRANGADFRAIHTLGKRDWTQQLRCSPFGGARIVAPPLPDDDLVHFGRIKRRLGQLYNGAVGTRAGRWFALRFGPLFHIVAEKPPDVDQATGSRPSIPAIPPRSTRSEARS